MASIKEILSSYGSAARANYPQGDDVETDMDYIVAFITEHGYEFQDDLEPITNYFTVTNLPMAPNLKFTFKRIDKIEHHGNPSNLRCIYKLVNVRTTIFDTVRSDKKWEVEYLCKKLTDEEADLKGKGIGSCHVEFIKDPVNHPNHYEMVGPFESFDIIVESLGIDGARQFCQGNIIKYQTRYREKNGEEDLKKRHWYSRMDQMLAKCKTIEDYYKLKESDF